MNRNAKKSELLEVLDAIRERIAKSPDDDGYEYSWEGKVENGIRDKPTTSQWREKELDGTYSIYLTISRVRTNPPSASVGCGEKKP